MVDSSLSERRKPAIELANQVQKHDLSLRSFTINGYGRFVELCKNECSQDGKLFVRVAFAVNTSEKLGEYAYDTLWIVKPGTDIKTKDHAIFTIVDDELKVVERFDVKTEDWKHTGETRRHWLVSDKTLEDQGTVTQQYAQDKLKERFSIIKKIVERITKIKFRDPQTQDYKDDHIDDDLKLKPNPNKTLGD